MNDILAAEAKSKGNEINFTYGKKSGEAKGNALTEKEEKKLRDEGFSVEFLGNGVSCVVSKEHTFGTDALLLSEFALPKNKDRCCDLGTGCGIIPLLWCRNENIRNVTAVEIQEKGIEQLKKSIEISSLESRITPVHSDLKCLKGKVENCSFTLVTMNPPYTAKGAGIESAGEADKLARHENACTFGDICSAAAKLLTYGGRLCMCIRPERLFELMNEMKKNKLEPKRLRLVSKCPGKAPWLALVEGRLGLRSGLTVMPELFMESL